MCNRPNHHCVKRGRSWMYKQPLASPAQVLGFDRGRSWEGGDNGANSYAARVSASWEADLWGRQANAVQAGEANVQAAVAVLEGAHVSLAAEVALNYIQLRSLQNRLRIAQDNLGIQQGEPANHRMACAGRVGHFAGRGAGALFDGANGCTRFRRWNLRWPKYASALASLTGQPPRPWYGWLLAAQPLPVAPDSLAMTLPADTLRQRPDVRAQEQKVIAAVANLSSQERANFPTLRLSGSLGLNALTLKALSGGHPGPKHCRRTGCAFV